MNPNDFFSDPEALAAVESVESDGSVSMTEAAEVEVAPHPDFEIFIAGLGLNHFSAREFLVMGNSNASGNCAGRNRHPARELWTNIAATARTLDRLRSELGVPIRLLSVYRHPNYNSCIGGASRSFHMAFNAADFQAASGSPSSWADKLAALRAEGVFSGGIGRYGSFVHVDTRGQNVDWNG